MPKTPRLSRVGDGAVRAVHVRDDLPRDVLLEIAVHRRVNPLAAAIRAPAIGHDHDHLGRLLRHDLVEQLVDGAVQRPAAEVRHRPVQRTAAKAMEQIGDGVAAGRAMVAGREIDHKVTPAGVADQVLREVLAVDLRDDNHGLSTPSA